MDAATDLLFQARSFLPNSPRSVPVELAEVLYRETDDLRFAITCLKLRLIVVVLMLLYGALREL